MTKKICIVVHSRANYGRVKTVMRAIADHKDLELQLLVGSSALLQRYGAVVDIIRRDGFTESAIVHSIIEGETPTTMAKSTGLAIIELSTHFENLKPDAVLTVADRFETLATAVAASYEYSACPYSRRRSLAQSMNLFGMRSGKLAHIHFPATKRAKEYLLRMGEEADTIHLTGCSAIDLAAQTDLSLPDDIFFSISRRRRAAKRRERLHYRFAASRYDRIWKRISPDTRNRQLRMRLLRKDAGCLALAQC